jgi:hypothetical protein
MLMDFEFRMCCSCASGECHKPGGYAYLRLELLQREWEIDRMKERKKQLKKSNGIGKQKR